MGSFTHWHHHVKPAAVVDQDDAPAPPKEPAKKPPADKKPAAKKPAAKKKD